MSCKHHNRVTQPLAHPRCFMILLLCNNPLTSKLIHSSSISIFTSARDRQSPSKKHKLALLHFGELKPNISPSNTTARTPVKTRMCKVWNLTFSCGRPMLVHYQPLQRAEPLVLHVQHSLPPNLTYIDVTTHGRLPELPK